MLYVNTQRSSFKNLKLEVVKVLPRVVNMDFVRGIIGEDNFRRGALRSG